MSWIEEAREALEVARRFAKASRISKLRMPDEIIDDVGIIFAKALAAIPDEDPMEKLLDWLRDNYNLDNQLVIDYIKKELGYGKENE